MSLGDHPNGIQQLSGDDGGRHDLGILFVHGIGNQRKGDTVTRWGDVLADWIARWTEGAPAKQSTVRIVDVELQPGTNTPAHATLQIERGKQISRWLLAEAWWAGEFATPTFREIVSWSFRAVPLTLTSHTTGSLRRARRHYREASGPLKLYYAIIVLVGILLGPLISLLLAPVVLAIMILLFLIGALPIPSLRGVIVRIQRSLTGSIGDSLVLLESPLQSGAIVQKIHDGIAFLEKRGVKATALVCHSQGAAVAKKALEGRPEDIGTFITLGSGIKKLDELDPSQGDTVLQPWVSLSIVLGAAITGLILLSDWRAGAIGLQEILSIVGWLIMAALLGKGALLFVRWRKKRTSGESEQDQDKKSDRVVTAMVWVVVAVLVGSLFALFALSGDRSLSLLAALYFGLFVVGTVLVAAWLVTRPDPEVSPSLRENLDRWVDIYSRSDLVPNGKTVTSEEDWPEPCEVRNLDSAFRDHSSYQENYDQCLPVVVRELETRSSNEWLVTDTDGEHLDEAHRHRTWRVSWLIGTRWVVFAATMIFLIRIFNAARPVTERSYVLIRSAVPGGIRGWLPIRVEGNGSDLLTILGVVVLGLIAYSGATFIWKFWDRADRRAFFAHDSPNPASNGLHVLMVYLVIVVILAFIGEGLVEALRRQDLRWASLVMGAAVFGVMINALSRPVTTFVANKLYDLTVRGGNSASDEQPSTASEINGSGSAVSTD